MNETVAGQSPSAQQWVTKFLGHLGVVPFPSKGKEMGMRREEMGKEKWGNGREVGRGLGREKDFV